MIQSLGLLLALSGVSGAYGNPEDISVSVGRWGAWPGATYRAGDISLTFGQVIPGGDEACRFTIYWTTPDTDIPALGAPIVISDAFSDIATYRVSNVELSVFLQGESPDRIINMAVITGQGYSAALAEHRYGNASTPGASGTLSSDAVIFPIGTPTGTIIATAIGQLGNGVFVGDPGVTGSGVSITEPTPDLRGRTPQDIINEYLAYGGAFSWQVVSRLGDPTFQMVTKGQNGTYSGGLPDLGAGEGIKLVYQLTDIETEFAVAWRDPTQHDAVQVTVVPGNGAVAWPNGIGLSRQKWIDAGNSVRSLSDAESVGAQYAGNALNIDVASGEISIPWPVMLTGPNGEQYPPWRIPANSYIQATGFNTGLGYCKAEDFFVVRTEWRQDELRTVCTLGVLQTELKRLRQSQVVTNSRVGTAPPGISANQAPQWSYEKGFSGGYPPLDANTVPTAYNETRVPPSNLPVRANHKGFPLVLDNGNSPIELGKSFAVNIPFTFHLHMVEVSSDQSFTGTIQILTGTMDNWISTGPGSLTPLTPDIQVTVAGAFGAKQTTVGTSTSMINILLKQGDKIAINVIANDLSQRLTVDLSGSLDPEEDPVNWSGVTGDPTKRVAVTAAQVL